MSASHAHGIPSTDNERALRIALALTGSFLIAEVIGGVLTGSLALISDAAHMLTDTAALAIALAAIRIARRPADRRRTYGYHRFEILAAAFNALLLFAVALYILVEAYRRFTSPPEIHSVGMLVVASIGLIVNLISIRLLSGGQSDSLNVKGAYLEVWSDLLGSIGVIVGAVVIQLTGWSWVDPLVAVAIGLWVLPRTWILLKDSLNILLEGVPGVAKTLAVETFARVIGGSFSRVQFTPDLVPTDLIGTRIYRQGQEKFDTELGPVVANFLLADEINRAPAKVQSALLEVMAERHVSIGGTTYPMPDPFLVMATQNPIENEGVYPLPEAQRDRFLFKVLVGYPSVEEEREIVYRMGNSVPTVSPVLDPHTMVRLQKVAGNVFVHHALVDYVVRVINATRRPAEVGLTDVAGWLSYGASPRATLGIVAAARALFGDGS